MESNELNFNNFNKQELIKYIENKKKEFGDDLVIPAHHYQTQAVVDLSDFVGDSYKLAVKCSQLDAKYIVFCGVKFMAEAASTVSKDFQKILIPEIEAGCPLADKITGKQFEKAIQIINTKIDSQISPVVYVNSSIKAKEITGEHSGATCTSSSADKVINHFLQKGKKVFFAPDYNLGVNTSNELGLKEKQIARITQNLEIRTAASSLNKVKLFLWDGYCYVHRKFKVGDIENLKKNYPGIQIIVHPECSREVVKNSDFAGSTQQMITYVKDAKKSSTIAIGTEFHLVKRLNKQNPDKTVIPLRKSICKNMVKINLKNLAQSLLSLEKFENNGSNLLYEVKVEDKVKENAKKALNKMIEIVEA